jgi:putative ABC transport system permease protein
MSDLMNDLRYALRRFFKNPAITAAIIFPLALGIGTTTAIFSLVNGILLRPLPYFQPDRLVRVWLWKGLHQKGVFLALKDGKSSLENVAAFTSDSGFNLSEVGPPERLDGSAVSTDLFSVLGVNAELGRTLRTGEDRPGQDGVVIISHALWQQRFGADPGIIGRRIKVNDESREVVGVMPMDFHFPSRDTRIWVPLRIDPNDVIGLWALSSVNMIGRLRPGATPEQARAEVLAAGPGILKAFPWKLPDFTGEGTNVVALQQYLIGDSKPRLLILLGAAFSLLLITCINVANLLLAAAVNRQRQIAVRAVLGAGRWRITKQLLTESLLLAVISTGLGILLAMASLSLLRAFLPPDTPRLAEVNIDLNVLAFSAGLAVLTTLIFGLIPALQASSTELQQVLRDGSPRSGMGPGRGRLASAFVIGELAVAVVLVATSLLLVKSLWRLSQVDPGFSSSNVLAARITPIDSLCDEPAKCTQLYDELLLRLSALPGVQGVAAVNDLPLSGSSTPMALVVQDHPLPPEVEPPAAQMLVVTPGYLSTMKIPLLQGRNFVDADRTDGTHPVLVNKTLARKFWSSEQSAIGKRIKPPYPKEWWTIVGVVNDVKTDGLEVDPGPQFYLPYGGFATLPTMTLVVRSEGDATRVAGDLRGIVSSIDPNLPVSDIRTVERVASESMTTRRSTMILLTVFAVLAFLLGAIGIYSVTSYSVSWRTHEIGLRMALGAQKGSVLWLFMRQGLVLMLFGVAVGVAGTIGLTRILRGLLYGISPSDPQTLVLVLILFAAVCLLAVVMPARRAANVDPMIALRTEV